MSLQSTILALGPTACWPMADAAGSSTAADVSGNGHVATVMSGVTFGQSMPLGADTGTGATAAAGNGNGLSAPASSAWNVGTGNFTALAWVRFPTEQSGTQVPIGFHSTSGTADWRIEVDGNGTDTTVSWLVGTTSTPAAFVLPIDTNTHLVALRRNAGTVTLSIDGTTKSASTATGVTSAVGDSTAAMGLLDYATAAFFPFLGDAKFLTFFNGTALTDAQVASVYQAGAGTPPPTVTTIAVTNANWLHTPFNTYGDGNGGMAPNNLPYNSSVAAIVCEGGMPASITVAGTGNATLNIDVSRMNAAGLAASLYPLISYRVTSAGPTQTPWTDFQPTNTSTGIPILTAAAVGQYQIEYVYKSGCSATGGVNKWVPTGTPAVPPFAVVVTGLTLDLNATTLQPTVPSGGLDLMRGDSITEGLRMNSADDTQITTNDSRDNWPAAVGTAFGSQWGQTGYGATGYEVGGTGGAPPFNVSAGLYFQGALRLDANGHYQPQPTRIWVAHGTNGTTTQADVAAAILMERSRAPSAMIFMCVPPGGFAGSQIHAAVAASTDPNVFVLDTGPSMAVGLAQANTPSSVAWDGLHPNNVRSPQYGAALARLAGAPTTADAYKIAAGYAVRGIAGTYSPAVTIFNPQYSVSRPVPPT